MTSLLFGGSARPARNDDWEEKLLVFLEQPRDQQAINRWALSNGRREPEVKRHVVALVGDGTVVRIASGPRPIFQLAEKAPPAPARKPVVELADDDEDEADEGASIDEERDEDEDDRGADEEEDDVEREDEENEEAQPAPARRSDMPKQSKETDRDRMIAYIEKHPGTSAVAVADAIGRSRAVVGVTLRQLHQMGRVRQEHVDGTRKVAWYPIGFPNTAAPKTKAPAETPKPARAHRPRAERPPRRPRVGTVDAILEASQRVLDARTALAKAEEELRLVVGGAAG